ncbi:malate dehydrogenase [Sulfurovum mangrovi]|uniref:malate dehydrogenase n=1 Tax=Sulfurovum mangrovi TaxID=2893889 RepID=UPI001E3AD434|nr:malate dehydrogenase [Sulfurovum mangrovi]UFH59793.1 malate dehydrogenase [Sulfurovum mangrovi]
MAKGKKVTVIGTGNFGSTVAFILAMNGACHNVLLRGRDYNKAKGKALDMSQAANAARQHTVVRAAKGPEDMADSDIVVITAGAPRTPGMSRDDLLTKNADIVKKYSEEIREYAPDAVVIVVSNPLDVMTYVAQKVTGFPRERVLGMAGILDAARMAHFIYEKLEYGAGQIRATVMGGHGDTMVPLPKFTTVAGVPIEDLLDAEQIGEIVQKTRTGGAEIVNLLGDGSAYYAPAKSTAIMVEAMLRDTKQIHSCAIMLENDYGYSGIVSGVPVMIGAGGGEEVIKMSLKPLQQERFAKSVASVQEMVDKLYELKFFDKEA